MTQAEHIISKFGGLTALAKALGHKHPSTVQGWKSRGFIPPRHYPAIRNAAERLGQELSANDFVQFEEQPE